MPPATSGSFNITQAAEGYSALAGILAGFSFAVLVWLVERLNTKDANIAEDVIVIRALVFLGLTFLGNLLVSFFWALILGEGRPESHRTQILSHIATWEMSQLAPMTMQAMTLVVSTAGSPYAVGLFRRIFFVTLGIGAAFLWTHTYAILTLDAPQKALDGAMFVVFPVFVLILVVGGFLSRCPVDQRWKMDNENSFSRFVTVLLTGILLAGLSFAVVSISSPNILMPHQGVGIANLLWAVFIGWSCAFLPDK